MKKFCFLIENVRLQANFLHKFVQYGTIGTVIDIMGKIVTQYDGFSSV